MTWKYPITFETQLWNISKLVKETVYAVIWMSLVNIMPGKKDQSQRATYSIIPFLRKGPTDKGRPVIAWSWGNGVPLPLG